MNYYSTGNKNLTSTFEEALMQGLAPDGGLYMPRNIPKVENSFIENLSDYTFQDIAFKIADNFVEGEIPENKLNEIIEDAINFPAPLVRLNDNISILELFHGPTLAFKDFGARFMSRAMSYFAEKSDKKINILVATSGDTGSAVASGFYGAEFIDVYILYPSGKVSEIQEKQLTTLDKNVTALEIDGTFDDCQKLVKSAFVDEEIKNAKNLSSANSINIARLIPQTFYYFEAYKQIQNKKDDIYFSIPSGNLGNLTAGLFAKKMGLPITKYIGATNSNSVFTEFINTGEYNPRPSVQTLSNAMDVGNPSNLARIIDLYDHDNSIIMKNISSNSHDDTQTIEMMKSTYEKYNYVIDPHGSVGLLALEEFISENNIEEYSSIVFETAHPAKFKDTVEDALGIDVELPEALQKCISKEKKTTKLSNDYSEFKEYLLNS
ncbi:MAG: threonine synthase [Melioribacteraceae bacterium]|nr:threonine synthase [Melioribacteraceae bacterium]